MNYEIIESESFEEFVQKGVDIIIRYSLKTLDAKNRLSMVLSGGRTPPFFFKKLVESDLNLLDWGKVDFFWSDERCIDPHHLESNFWSAQNHLISKLPQTGEIHQIKGTLKPSVAAENYKEDIDCYLRKNKVKGFDIAILGMGEDGHVASIFPPVTEKHKTAKVFSTNKEHNLFYRVSLGLPTINNIKIKLLLVNNRKKHDVFFKSKTKLPVHLIKWDKVLILNQ